MPNLLNQEDGERYGRNQRCGLTEQNEHWPKLRIAALKLFTHTHSCRVTTGQTMHASIRSGCCRINAFLPEYSVRLLGCYHNDCGTHQATVFTNPPVTTLPLRAQIGNPQSFRKLQENRASGHRGRGGRSRELSKVFRGNERDQNRVRGRLHLTVSVLLATLRQQATVVMERPLSDVEQQTNGASSVPLDRREDGVLL